METFGYYKKALEDLGHTVTSRWLAGDDANLVAGKFDPMRHPFTDQTGVRPENVRTAGFLGLICVEDIVASDIIFFFGEPLSIPARNGGRMVELGIAIGWNECARSNEMKRIIIIGPTENGFTCLSTLIHVETFDEAIFAMKYWYGHVAT